MPTPPSEPQPFRYDEGLFYDDPAVTYDGFHPAVLNQNPTTPPMQQNLISETLAPTLVTELLADIAALRAKMTFIMSLTNEQRQELLKLGLGNAAIADLLRSAATENPGELASNFPLAEWDKDRAFATALRPVTAAYGKLGSDLEDTQLAVDSDVWNHALEAYSDLKKSATGPMIDEARAFFRQRHGRRTPPTT